jgi:hypothetical protein
MELGTGEGRPWIAGGTAGRPLSFLLLRFDELYYLHDFPSFLTLLTVIT